MNLFPVQWGRWFGARGKASVSASDEKSAEQSRPRRRWYRSRWLPVAAAVLLLLLGVYLYCHFSAPGAPPPDVNLEGVDPAVAAAVEQARAQVQQSPRSAEAWGKFGMVLLVHQFQSQAVLCFDQAERLGPRELRWPYFQALEALLRTDLQAARRNLERAVPLCGDEFDGPQLALAEVLLGLEDFDEAQKHFSLLLEQNPRHARAHLGLARIAVKRGNLRASLEPLSLAQRDPCTRQAACELLAEVQQRLGNPTSAEAARRRAAELPADLNWPDPLRDELAAMRTGKVNWLRQAEAHNREGHKAEALALLQQTVREYPDADDAWFALGRALYERKILAPAEAALRRAAALAPTAYEHVNELGRILIARGNGAEAMKCFRKALELKPNSALAWHNLGSCLVAANDRGAALEAYGKAVRYAPEMFEAHFTLALLLADRGQYDEALVHAQHAVRLKPSHQPARQLLEQLKKDQASSRPGP
jgi:tetratricopeptide (TPR) repeat protein